MNKSLVILIVLAVIVLVLLSPALAPQRAEASGPVCPAPGGGYPGALNMAHDPTMLQIMQDHTAPQGDDGMGRAVTNTSC